MTDKADNDALWSTEIDEFVDAGLQKVSRNPSDHEVCIAYRHAILAALRTPQPDETETLRAEVARLREALGVADDAIKEMFRYYDGGETRGSYDGKPERNQLRKAGYATTAALKGTDHGRG